MRIANISDHLPICYISNAPATIDTLVNENLFHRNITDINIIKFKYALTDVQWYDVIELNDVNACYKNFMNKFSGLYDKDFPKQRKKVIARNPNNAWIIQGILFSIKKKHRYYKESLRKKTPSAISKYKAYKNKLTKIITASEKSYFMNKFESVETDIKKTAVNKECN